jgi:hypothetical protein
MEDNMSFEVSDSNEVMNEINMTPLVDVMLVLLIIFIITIPVVQKTCNSRSMRKGGSSLASKPLLLMSSKKPWACTPPKTHNPSSTSGATKKWLMNSWPRP